MRLFAALPLSPTAVERLTRLRLRLSGPKDGLRWSEPEQWHITLQFYGEVSEERAECIQRALEQIALPAPEISIDSLGFFPAKGILHVAVEPSSSLATLQADVLRRSETCGVVPESRPFRPHITLARSRGKVGQGTLKRLSVSELLAFGAPLRWVADECLLIQSTLRPQGALYTVIARVPLQVAPRSDEG